MICHFPEPPVEQYSNGVDLSELELEFDKETMFEDVENLFRNGEKEKGTHYSQSGVVHSISSLGKHSSEKKKSESIKQLADSVTSPNHKINQTNLVADQKIQHDKIAEPEEKLNISPLLEHSSILPNLEQHSIVEKEFIVKNDKETLTKPIPVQPTQVESSHHSPPSTIPTPVAKKAPKKKPSVSNLAVIYII